MDYEDARLLIYGMPYDEYKKLHQRLASAEQLQAFNVGGTARTAPKHSDVCSGGTVQGLALQAMESVHSNSVARTAPKHSDVCTGGSEQGVALQASEEAAARSSPSGHSPVLRVGILTVSDRASAGVYADRSGPATHEAFLRGLKSCGYDIGNLVCVNTAIVPDERPEIELTLRDWCDRLDDQRLNLVLTTGGTGFAPRDVTPEATKSVCEKDAPGLALAALQAGAQRHPLALASRLVAGIRRRTVILNLPGSPAGASECLEPVVPLLLRAVSLCDQARL